MSEHHRDAAENDFHKTKPKAFGFVPTHTKAYCSMKTCFIFEIKKINERA
jgi:hypothetical protein